MSKVGMERICHDTVLLRVLEDDDERKKQRMVPSYSNCSEK